MAPPLSRRRRIWGLLLAVAGLPALTLAANAADAPLNDCVPLFLAAVVGVALAGGLWPALLAAVGGFVLLNYFFTPPVHTLAIGTPANLFALGVFVVVALAVSWVVDVAARRTADARTLAAVAGGVLGGTDPLDGLLRQLRDTFRLDSVTMLEPVGDGWRVAASVGEPAATPDDGQTETAAGVVLVMCGPELPPGARRIVRAFAAQAVVALRQQRLAVAAEGDRVRSALLAAVGHDLRTPLASAKAAVAGLRSPGVEFDDADRAELLATADESLDRLAALVANLLDMSRLQAGALAVRPVEVFLEDVVPRALDELGAAGHAVRVRLPADLPAVRADPGLLERVVVNVAGNALRFSPPGRPPEIDGGVAGATVELRVVDHGPGIPAADRERVFVAFQRLGDRDNHAGVGLGLALSRGLAEAMGGTLRPEETPGGGLTMVLALPAETPEAGP